MKHTPGPWVAIPMNSRALTHHGATEPIFEDGLWWITRVGQTERLPICIVDHADDHHDGTRDKAAHDANLIAAAPELLEVLKTAVETIRAWHGEATWDIYNRSSPEMKRINAAIAKAEGKE